MLFRLGHIQHGTQKSHLTTLDQGSSRPMRTPRTISQCYVSTVYRYLCIDLDVAPVAVPTLGRVILSGPAAARLLRDVPRGRQRGAPTRRDEAARRAAAPDGRREAGPGGVAGQAPRARRRNTPACDRAASSAGDSRVWCLGGELVTGCCVASSRWRRLRTSSGSARAYVAFGIKYNTTYVPRTTLVQR